MQLIAKIQLTVRLEENKLITTAIAYTHSKQ